MTKFKILDVRLHLSRRFPYASTCFAQETVSMGDFITAPELERWIKRYFITNGWMIYREIEAECIQYMEINQ